MIAVVGSVAANVWLPKEYQREPKDLDIVGTYEDVQEFIQLIRKSGERVLSTYPINSGKTVYVKTDKRIIEAEIAWPESSAEGLLSLVQSETGSGIIMYGKSLMVPRLDVLYMLKMSHRYLKDSPHFLKTLRDIQLMRKLGCTIRPEHTSFFEAREKATYTYALPKLNQSKADFFDNSNSIYIYDHDSIHEAIKLMDKPAYEYFKPESSEVFTSKQMFFDCSEEIRLYAAYEEIGVLSLERSITAFPNVDKRWAFDMAHMKLATSISSGWFRAYVWENYDTIQAMYSTAYVDKFYAALEAGKILPFKGVTQ